MKDITNYLHLYLGCEVEYIGITNGKQLAEDKKANKDNIFYVSNIAEIKGIKRGILKHIEYDVKGNFRRCKIGRKGLQSHYGSERFKLLLRPLSDMTEKEKQIALHIGLSESDTWIGGAKRTDYLLKQGFDLFNLIPEGLAIDKTKLNSEQNPERSVATKIIPAYRQAGVLLPLATIKTPYITLSRPELPVPGRRTRP